VSTDAGGISIRSKRMLSRIGSRSDTAVSALIAESRTIWKGTTEQASVSATASPSRLRITRSSR
jgi:hypothetical protein